MSAASAVRVEHRGEGPASPAGPAGSAGSGGPGGQVATPPVRRRWPRTLLGTSGAVLVVLLLPLAFLLFESSQAGVPTVAHLIWRPLTGTLLRNTVVLTLVVTALCGVIGTLTAWCVECTDLPGRRIWGVLVVIPFAIPDFIVAFGWSSLTTSVEGFKGAVLVMTLAVYPLVHLPVAASLRSADPAQEEVARGLGLGPVRTFLRVTLGQARLAILGGCVLVALALLAEYGAFEILRYQTFTTEIFTEFNNFNIPTACGLSIVLVLLGVAVLGGDAAGRAGGRSVRTAAFAQRVARRHALGRAKLPVLLGFCLLVGLALGVPVGSAVYWMFQGGAGGIGGVSILDAGWHTAAYSAAAAAVATAMALPVAFLAVRHENRFTGVLERTSFLVMAVPGVVVAFALSYFAERYVPGVYQTAPLLVLAYAVLFFPLALVGVRASVAYAPLRLEEVGRSLGVGRLAVLRRVTLPLVGPGLAASFCLVFLAAVTELTATLILIPTGVQTLATQFWAYQENLSYGQAAPFALVIMGIAAVPSYVLSRWFDRLPQRATAAT